MIEIKRDDRCCGCGACQNVCPKHCITMVENKEGFRYPHVDKEQCINCGMCEKVCPYLCLSVKGDILKQPSGYYIRSQEDEVLRTSSSGGMFFELAKLVLSEGGVAYGAVWGDRFDDVYHRRVEKLDELYLLQGSKYVQSDMRDCFTQAQKDLNNGKLVIFSGTPCQISGLFSFLKKDYDNLLTCDLICHGVPSPLVLRKFLAEKEKKAGKKVVRYYRDKTLGWKPAAYRIVYQDGFEEIVEAKDNPVSKLFTFYNQDQRNSCYCCRFTRLPRIADISLGDYFVEKDALDLKGNVVTAEDNKGMSLITVNTKQGERFFERIKERTDYTQLQLHTITSWHLFQGPGSAASPRSRRELFYLLEKGLSVTEAYELMYGNGNKLKRILYKIHRRLRG